MTREEVIAKLKATEGDLRALGIGELYLFGSYARGEATETSDVDVLVTFGPKQGNRFRSFMTTRSLLQDAVSRQIDLGTPDSFAARIRQEIERDAVRVF